ncbi:hypothetical protein B0H13DRAFT_500738 [Mycena leptocephala]|nr:hypothetical protein B0H13DRAFT_500738 [Mycena leptocephala]
MATFAPSQNTSSTPSRGSLSSFGCWIKNAPTRAPSSRDGDFSPPHRTPLVPPLEVPQVLLDAGSKTRRHARRHRGMATSHPLQNAPGAPSRWSITRFGRWPKNASTQAPLSRMATFSFPCKTPLVPPLDGPQPALAASPKTRRHEHRQKTSAVTFYRKKNL